MNWETYLALGDSITIGSRTYLGYPELAGCQLGEKLNKQWNIINYGVSGFKAIDLARYTDAHFLTLRNHAPSVTSILIGTNDVKENTPVEDYLVALDLLIIKAKLLTVNKNVFICSIPEFHPGIMYPYSFEMNKTVAVYNEHIEKMAAKHQIRVLTFNHTGADFYDGVHLNRAGIENFATQITGFILKDKGVNIG